MYKVFGGNDNGSGNGGNADAIQQENQGAGETVEGWPTTVWAFLALLTGVTPAKLLSFRWWLIKLLLLAGLYAAYWLYVLGFCPTFGIAAPSAFWRFLLALLFIKIVHDNFNGNAS